MKLKPKLTLQIPEPQTEFDEDDAPPPLRPTDEPPAQLLVLNPADIETRGVIGHGSFSTVYQALYKPLNKIVAMKVIKREVSRNVRRQLAAELRSATAKCDCLVGVVDAFYSDGCVTVLLEFMAQGSLRSVLRRSSNRRFPNEELGGVLAKRVLTGLHFLHKTLHVIHRDIKPANLLFSSEGEVKIADFGVSGQLESTLAQAHSWVGTVAYMSPERVKDQPYTANADIWSFGLTIAEALLGHYPYFSNENEQASESTSAPPLRPSSPLPPMRPSKKPVVVEEPIEQREVGLASFWQLLQFIDNCDPPTLPSSFSVDCQSFVANCLQRNTARRWSAERLLAHPFVSNCSLTTDDMRQWLSTLEPLE